MRYKLKEIFDLQMGKTPSRKNLDYWNTKDYKWISIADLSQTRKYISDTKEYLSCSAVEESGIKVIPANTVVMSFKLSIGKIAITSEDMYSNEAIMAFHDKHVVELLPEYIYYMFLCKNWDEGSNKAVMGKTLNKATLSEVEINICSVVEQREIVDVLDKIMRIMSDREEEIKLLDDLIKSRFVEMFGGIPDDKKVMMIEICKIITDGTHQPPRFTTTGIPFLFVSNIITNEIQYDAEKFISKETYGELIKRTPIAIGDILLSTVGSYGHPAIVKSDKPFCFQRHIAYIKPDAALVNSEYLRGAILSEDVQRQIDERVKGIAQKTLNLSEIRKLRLPLPPMEQQEQFAVFVAQTDKSKLTIQKSLDELETLNKALMQKYFGGNGV